MPRKLELGALFGMILFAASAVSQVAVGAQPFGSFGGGPFDTINLGNLNFSFGIPILNKAGRGTPFTYTLAYSSSIWTPVTSNGTTTWQPGSNWGWQGATEVSTGYVSFTGTVTFCYTGRIPTGSKATQSNWVYHDYFGRSHTFPGSDYFESGTCGTTVTTMNSIASDGSGYTLKAVGDGGVTLTSRGGRITTPPINSSTGAATATDANGNQITVDGSGNFYDTLSGTTPVLTVSGTAPDPTRFTYTSPTGSVYYTMNYGSYNVKTSFGCSGIQEYTATGVSLVSSISLPDGSQYSFTYESNSGYYTGRLASVTLPAGGTISYTYSGGNSGIECADGSTAGLTRTVNPGGQWSYTRTGSGNNWTTTIVDPDTPPNHTVINFEKDSSTTNPTNDFYETQRVVNQGTSTPLTTVITCYNGQHVTTPSSCYNTAVASPVTRTTVFRYLPVASGVQAETDTTYDSTGYGLVQEVDDYDYGTAQVGSLIRKTLVTYGSYGAGQCTALGNGIIYRPCKITVEDDSNNIMAQTNYTYDEGTPTASGATQHVTVTGSRGNLTTVAALASSATTLYRKFTYYDTGMLNTSGNPTTTNAPSGTITTYNYSSSTASCDFAFPTSTTEPLNLSRSMTWTCSGGFLATLTDENNDTTTYTRNDPLWRLTKVAQPDGGSTTTAYTTSNSFPWYITQTTAVDSGHSESIQTNLDGLGRPIKTANLSDPDGYDYVDTVYDDLDRVASVSNPYHSTSDPTYGITQYSYDALGRPQQITNPYGTYTSYSYRDRATEVTDEAGVQKINQVDGLGRLVFVCDGIGSSTQANGANPTACGLDITPANGFLTSYAYDALGNVTSVNYSGQTRSFLYDELSRPTSSTNPENGTTTYSYDTGTPGALYQRTSPKPNQTGSATVVATYSWDALLRPTEITYNDGSTPDANFVYDMTTGFGTTALYNTKGRLTYEYSGPGYVIAGTIFSYDKMGRVSTLYECAPLACTAPVTPSTISYNYNYIGEPTSLSDSDNSRTLSYGYNTIGQLTQITSTQAPSPVISSISYNALGQPVSDTRADDGDRQYSYDKRGRLTSLTGGSWYSLSLGYNSDSDVTSATDSINGTWTYGYAPHFAHRLASATCTANCPNGWGALNWTYDQFGNRWQQNVTSGSGPQPSYSFTHTGGSNTNQIVGSGVTYDAAGNMTADGLGNTYVFDAENRMVSMNSGSFVATYDAMGHRVEENAAGSVNDFIFGLDGKVIHYNAPGLPGLGEEIRLGEQHIGLYANGTLYMAYQDQVGSIRRWTQYASGGSVNQETVTNLPFGDALTINSGSGVADHEFFSGFKQDSDGEFVAAFRRYAGSQGRWMVPDPAGLAAVDATNSQTWNRYAYITNDPCSLVDPLGLGPDCTFNIKLVGNNLLTSAQMVDAALRINSILGPANVNATFVQNNPDFTATFLTGGAADVYGTTPVTFWGGAPGTGFLSPGNEANIYIDSINTEVQGQNLGYAVGQVVAHEFSHFLFGSRFAGEEYDFNNLVVEGDDAAKMLNPNVGFTSRDLGRVHSLCQKLHPRGHPGGGGGGSKDGGGGSGGGTACFVWKTITTEDGEYPIWVCEN
jgi:RHS repeat-associated protein